MKKIVALVCMLFIVGCDNAPATPDYFSKKLSDVELAYKEHPEDINKTDEYDTTPLITAIMYDRIDIAKFLINNKADVNYIPKQDYCSALGCAIGSKKNNTELIDLLIKNGADINKQNSDGNTPILQALNKDMNVKNVHAFLKYNPDINIKGKAGVTPLCAFAIIDKDVSDTINLIIQHGAKLNQGYDDNDTTCLVYSIHFDAHINNIKALIENGENVNLKSKDGWVALQEAADKKNSKVIKLLLANKADVNSVTKEGWTALMRLAANEKDTSSLIELLLQNGANINQQSNEGATALALAITSGHVNNIKTLLKHNPNLDLSPSGYWPNLLLAIDKRDNKIVNLLLDKGANPNVNAENGPNALMVAVHSKNYDIVKSLVEHGADVNSVVVISGVNNTPLILAASSGYLDIVKYLVEHGANIDYDPTGEPGIFSLTALGKSIINNHVDIAEYLVSKGASIKGLITPAYMSRNLETMRYVANLSTEEKVKDLKQMIHTCDTYMINGFDMVSRLPEEKQKIIAGSNYFAAVRLYVFLSMIPESRRNSEFYGSKLTNKNLNDAFLYTINELEYRNILFAQTTEEYKKDIGKYFAKQTAAKDGLYFELLIDQPVPVTCMELNTYINSEE